LPSALPDPPLVYADVGFRQAGAHPEFHEQKLRTGSRAVWKQRPSEQGQ